MENEVINGYWVNSYAVEDMRVMSGRIHQTDNGGLYPFRAWPAGHKPYMMISEWFKTPGDAYAEIGRRNRAKAEGYNQLALSAEQAAYRCDKNAEAVAS